MRSSLQRVLCGIATLAVIGGLSAPVAQAAPAEPSVPDTPAVPAASGYAYDPVNVDDCRQRATNAGATAAKPYTWTKNHYAYCQVSYQGGEFLSTKTNRTLGVVLFRATLVGAGSNTERKATFTLYVDDVHTAITPIDGVEEGFNPDAVNVSASMDCTGRPSAASCTAAPGGGRSQTVGEWKKSGQNTASFTFTSDSSTGAASGAGAAERIAQGTFQVRFTFTHAESLPGKDQLGPKGTLRFDSAPYMEAGHRDGVVFPAMSYLTFSLQDAKAPQSILHIWLAQHHPDLTYPIVAGKTIPGYDAAHPLTRLADKAQAQVNRDVSTAICRRLDPTYGRAKGTDCDEYPFASTYEGAARAHGDSSVMILPAGDNRSSGSRLGNWYAIDRVLDGDPFFIKVVGTPPATLPGAPIYHLP